MGLTNPFPHGIIRHNQKKGSKENVKDLQI